MRMRVWAMSVVCAFVTGATAIAAPVTWEDSGFLTYVTNLPLFPGLTVGTPWTLRVTFDPNGPFTPAAMGQPGSNCNIYSSQATSFTLGSYAYTNPSGRIWTNSLLPADACSAAPTGVIQFDWVGGWITPPGAWNLNGGVLIAGYTDAAAGDGSLPAIPSLTGFSTGLGFYSSATDRLPAFQANTFSPVALVPEPGTLSLVGFGLVYGWRRLRR